MVQERIISVIGLGYVGLPVAISFAKHVKTIGYDINTKRLSELQNGIDINNEVTSEELKQNQLIFTSDLEILKEANFHIITVPTPIDEAKRPDLTPMFKASEMIAKVLKKGDIVVYESTVYPGVTEDECLPILEKFSGLKGGVDFKIGYSPERINPGDKKHRFHNITKVVSGMDAEALDIIANTYSLVVEAGVYKAPTIKTAEAAKVIENTQRDLNIALMNELALIFDKMEIETTEVLKAASTKWNFLNFTPGLVGGHCIGVDPYYLTHKSEMLGYHPQVILAGRRINDNMGKYIAQQTIKTLIRAGKNVSNSTVTILGLTFKENCPDIRNSKVIDIISELKDFGIHVQVHDSLANPEEVEKEYGICLTPFEKLIPAEALVVAVNHDSFKNLSPQKLLELTKPPHLLIDVKSTYNPDLLKKTGLQLWRL